MLQAKTLFPIAAEAKSPLEPLCNESFVTRLRDRDAEAFEQLIREQSPTIHRLVSRLLGWQTDCEDVVQEIFVAAWERIDRFRGDAKIESWLYAIALNQCRKIRRGKGAWREAFSRLCATYSADDSQTLIESTPEEGRQYQVEQIQLALNELTQRDRELIVLCCLEEKPADDVAKLLKIRKNTLEVRLHRARKKLKQILAAPNNKS